ncbi:MAG: hypothetical protein LBB36_02145 [Fibromonadaceae bacterium]|nr:hypothetical protein [Fibromonadaceae bacterium]
MTANSQSNMGWNMSAAYKRYAASDSSGIDNKRIRPEGQSVFDWLLEDKELIHETDRDIREAGYEW